MENKFTDSEIMKALGWLERIERDTDVSEWAESIRIILGDYNRQRAEIERLQKENIILSRNADTAFQDGLNEAQELYQEQIKSEIKRQAISDFVETFEERCISGGIYPAFIKNQLYAVKGDMTEGDKL